MKTKLDNKRMEVIHKKCGFPFALDISNDRSKRGIYLAWKEGTSITLRKYSMNFIDMLVKDDDETIE